MFITPQFQILVIDNNIDFVKLLKKMLHEVCGNIIQSIHTAANAYEGLILMEQERFQYVFIDIDMPHSDGIAIIQLIKKNSYKEIEIIAISFHAEQNFRTQMLNAGASKYMAKDEIEAEKLIELFEYRKNKTIPMQHLYLANTSKTPSVSFNSLTGELNLLGRSLPEDANTYYDPLINWIAEYIENPYRTTVLNLHLEYFNSSSAKCIVKLMKELEKLIHKNFDVQINWYCNEQDEDTLDAYYSFKEIIRIPFQIKMLA